MHTVDANISSPDPNMSASAEALKTEGLRKQRLLLHCCCAPCATYVIKMLIDKYDITLFFYNPNIEPFEEYTKRKAELDKLSVMYSLLYDTQIQILDSGYDNKRFRDKTEPYKDNIEGGRRCELCFDLRLGETAKMAKMLDFDIFATTLSVSPYKNATVLNDSGIRQSNEHDVQYLESDFKSDGGYAKSIELSKEYDLYRQNYCGCLYSKTQNKQNKT